MSKLDPHQAIIEVGRRLDTRGLIAGTDGNISVRLGDDRILITAAGRHKGRLEHDDLVEVDLDGKARTSGARPSSEMAMHLAVYRARGDVAACVHAHPPHVTAFAASGEGLPDDILPEIVVFVGPIAHIPYAPPGTRAVPDAIEPFLAKHDCFLLANHGLLTVGRSLDEAYNRHEAVEHFARICILARQLGGLKSIPAEDLKRLQAMRDTYRGQGER